MHRSWPLVVLVACHDGDHATASNLAPPSRCAAVADHVVDLMAAAAKQPRETFKEGHDSYARHCALDGWSPELQTCFLEMTSSQVDGERCDALMTNAQRRGIANAVDDGKPIGSDDELERFAAQHDDAGESIPAHGHAGSGAR